MKKLLLTIFVAALAATTCLSAEETKVDGKWQLSMDTPHGALQGPLQVTQEGAKLSGTYEVEHIGSMKFTGMIEGAKISFQMETPGGEVTIKFTGTVEGGQMSGTAEPHGGAWKATRQ